ncbi:MAG: efflux RND transporter periplasmic adaptor subunit [Candidatus Neomarinimicrobiota bacterium]
MAKKKAKKKKKRRNIILISGAVVIVAVIVLVKVLRSDVQPIEVQREKVRRQKIVHKVTASGTIQPERQVDISANLSSLIMEIMVEEGDSVMLGQLLISLDKTRYEASAEQVLSRLKSAEANLVKSTALKDRAEKLYSEQLVSSQEFESATAQFQLAESEVELAKAALKSAMDDLSKTSLLAPGWGVVTQVRKDEGEMALGSTFQADVLMSIADLSRMEVVVEVNENDVVDVSEGDTAEIEIDAFQDTVFHGIVKEIAHVAQTTAVGTQEQVTNFNVKVRMLKVPEGIRQGMSATVDVITDVKQDVLAIPIQALTVRAEKPAGSPGKSRRREGSRGPPGGGEWKKQKMVEVVFVMSDTLVGNGENPSPSKSNGTQFAEQRPVNVGLSSETHYEVLSGLEEGEEIVTGSYKAISRDLQHNSPVTGKERGAPETEEKSGE